MADRSPVWIAFTDMALAIVAVVIVAVNPPRKAHGVERKAEYLLTASWPNTLDADVDLWAVGPERKPVFYSSRDIGCGRLDQDDRGFLDGRVRLADGSTATVPEFKETISIRCVDPGHWDAAVALYSFRDHGSTVGGGDKLGIPVHVELIGLNPDVRVLAAKDVVLDRVSQSINTISFDVGRDGKMTPADPPLGLIVEQYQHLSSGYTPGATP